MYKSFACLSKMKHSGTLKQLKYEDILYIRNSLSFKDAIIIISFFKNNTMKISDLFSIIQAMPWGNHSINKIPIPIPKKNKLRGSRKTWVKRSTCTFREDQKSGFLKISL